MPTIHLIANAHLDPVWLWDWREGMSEAITTCRTMLDLMDEFPDFTFVRGEAAVYQTIERYDPVTFGRISQRVAEGRWDIVGGTWVQPDNNLSGTATLLQQYTVGKDYFRQKFGRDVKVGWATDAFGHSAGLPGILQRCGIRSIALFRPGPSILPLAKPAFNWQGSSGATILAYRPLTHYHSERAQVTRLLDQTLEQSDAHGLEHIAFCFGTGNHGGGPTRRHLKEIAEWTEQHPDVNVLFSGWHRFFNELQRELAARPADFIPTHQGELNFCLRGCYASVAKFKSAYRKAEDSLLTAEAATCALQARALATPAHPDNNWPLLLFNSFHDILPGTSIERAYDDQLDQVGAISHNSQSALTDALMQLSTAIDTSVAKPVGDKPTGVPVLVWNPSPKPYRGPLELEVCLDYRPLAEFHNAAAAVPVRVVDPAGKILPIQTIACEHAAFESQPWRQRVVINAHLPALGWSVFTMGLDTTPANAIRRRRSAQPVTAQGNCISNHIFSVATRKGARGLNLTLHGKPLLDRSLIQAQLFDDPWGSWGGMEEEVDSWTFGKPAEVWQVTTLKILESGPYRAAMWAKMEGANSALELTLKLCANDPVLRAEGRILFNERDKRLKLSLPIGDQATFEVPGGQVTRHTPGEVPGGRWVITKSASGQSFGFASDSLYSFDLHHGCLRPTLARATRYAASDLTDNRPWQPAVDRGELRFRFALTSRSQSIHQIAAHICRPPVSLPVPPAPGPGPKSESLLNIHSNALHLVSLRHLDKHIELTLQASRKMSATSTLTWMGQTFEIAPLQRDSIHRYLLHKKNKRWVLTAADDGFSAADSH